MKFDRRNQIDLFSLYSSFQHCTHRRNLFIYNNRHATLLLLVFFFLCFQRNEFSILLSFRSPQIWTQTDILVVKRKIKHLKVQSDLTVGQAFAAAANKNSSSSSSPFV